MRTRSSITIRISLILLIMAVLFNFSITSVLFAEPVDDELERIKSEKEETQQKLEDIKKEESIYIEEVEQIEDQLLKALDELNSLNAEVSEKKKTIDAMTLELVQKEEEIAKIEEELGQKLAVFNERLKSIYKNRDRNILEVLLSSTGFVEFISRFKLMNLIAKQDAEAVSEIRSYRKRLIDTKEEVLEVKKKEEKQIKELETLLVQAEMSKNEVEEIYNKKKDILSATTANKDALILMENQLQVKELELTRMLQEFDYGNAPTGKLYWPVNGKISSGFGYRTSISGTKRFHSGLDLYAPINTPIYACESGEVLKAEYHGGYGYSILIYHGGGIATFYAHLSGFAVSVGQHVSRGQLIGYVGTTGYTTGPHLHLEVRINGTAQDPIGYL